MHTTLIRLPKRVLPIVAVLAGAVSGASAQQRPVEAVTSQMSSAVQRAEAMLARGQRDSAAVLLGARVTEQPTDGRAWFLLGRIHLADAQRWHFAGHPGEASSASLLLGFAGTSFEPAQELLTDSGGVFRVVVAMERATLRVETDGWDSLRSWHLPADELPLPPVLAELGRNLLASCPKNGVMVTGSSVAETAAIWGTWLDGDRSDVVLLRPEMYQRDARYRGRIAAAIGVDSASDLATAMTAAERSRPICLVPTVDSTVAPDVRWVPSQLVLASTIPAGPVAALSLFKFSRAGPASSVWTAAARDIYDLAARRNHALCTTLFAHSDALTPPAIPTCSP